MCVCFLLLFCVGVLPVVVVAVVVFVLCFVFCASRGDVVFVSVVLGVLLFWCLFLFVAFKLLCLSLRLLVFCILL